MVAPNHERKIMTFVLVLVAWIFSLCLHEFSHALVAYYGGDHTVKEKGYLSFNPLAYTHPFLSIILPIIILLIGGLGLPGGAVYINTHLLRSRAWDSAVSIAGPLSNILLGVLLAIPLWLGVVDPATASPLWAAYSFIVVLQVMAFLFNLIPIPPLDGFGIIAPWLGPELRERAHQVGAQYGLLILIVMFWYVEPVQRFFWGAVWTISGLLGVDQGVAIEGLRAFQILHL
jgi:Zn-dependent protease